MRLHVLREPLLRPEEELDHRDAKTGVGEIDRTFTISRDMGCSFTLEEIHDENLAMLLLGTQATVTNPATAGISNVDQMANADIEKQKWYEIKDSNGVRCLDIDEADLTIVGFDLLGLAERGATLFHNHPSLRDVLYVSATEEVRIT